MSSNNAFNQVTINATATQIVGARTGRASIRVSNHGATDGFLGGSNVTTSNGILSDSGN